MLHFAANLKVVLIGRESCGGAHLLGRALRHQGPDVRLIPAPYIKLFVKTNKNDLIYAEAIADAVGRPIRRFVPIKSDDQFDLPSQHDVCERWVMRRTATVIALANKLVRVTWAVLAKSEIYRPSVQAHVSAA